MLDKIATISYKYPLMHTYIISTVSLRHVSALKGPSSGGTTNTFPQQYQQNMYQIEIQFCEQRVTYYVAATFLDFFPSNIVIFYVLLTVRLYIIL